jgi:hypothetical protein
MVKEIIERSWDYNPKNCLNSRKGWLIGFVEGEGCFFVVKTGYPRFTISQADKDILIKIKEFFGCGVVYLSSSKNRVYEYRMTKIKDLPKLIAFFDNKLITKAKIEQFNKWKEVVIQKNKTFGKRKK